MQPDMNETYLAHTTMNTKKDGSYSYMVEYYTYRRLEIFERKSIGLLKFGVVLLSLLWHTRSVALLVNVQLRFYYCCRRMIQTKISDDKKFLISGS